RRVAVAVRVDPDDAGALAGAIEAGDGADGDGVVAAEHHRETATFHDVGHDRRELLARAHDLFHVVRLRSDALALVLLVGVRRATFVGILHADVAAVAHAVADVREFRRETGVADRRWPHVDAAAVPAKIHGHAHELHDRAALRPAKMLGCPALAHARFWKTAMIVPSAASSSPTYVFTFTRAKPRRILST